MISTPETSEETKLAIQKANHELAASEIAQAFLDAQDLIANTKDYAGQAVDAVIRCGAMCNAKKAELKEELGHGSWLSWRDTYLWELQKSHATIERYMALANSSQREEFKAAAPKTITQAYRVAGILPDPVTAQRKRLTGQCKPLKPAAGRSKAITLLHELYAQKSIESLLQTKEFSSWDIEELETWVRALGPLSEVRHRMSYALNEKLRGNGESKEHGMFV